MEKILGRFISQSNRDFPMDCETMDALQNNVALTAILGNIAGDRTILSGCEPEGANRTSGYIFLHTADFPDGEVLWFEGGSAVLGFYLKKETVSVTAFDVEYPQAHVKRTLSPGVGDEHFSWDDFRRIATNAELSEKETSQDADIAALAPPPLGIVQIFAGTEDKIPANYMSCDGRNLSVTEYAELHAVIGRAHTPGSVAQGLFRLPDLRGRFIVGFNSDDTDYNALAKTGGEKKHILTVDEMPSHAHKIYLSSTETDNGGEWWARKPVSSATSESATSEKSGEGKSHENRPPYCTLLYIMRVK
ncbi:MAG: phage tail protein [Tannerella sp.]|jgi:microcystin-dependent protein|nr:phage tail protein [Tannerella sp.]